MTNRLGWFAVSLLLPVKDQKPQSESPTLDGAADRKMSDTRGHPAAGETIAERYRLERLAGIGGMGHVFEAVDTRLNRRVAVKFISTATDGSLHDSLMLEARAMAGLDHPNLCRVLEAVIDTTDPFIVMDWVEGVDLRSAARSLDLIQRIALFVRIVEAVSSMHDEGLTHRDLKPGNILLNRRGEPVIVDFGLAGHTAKGDLKSGGTPGHAAPEQFNEPPSISPRCDVYSLGVILFELLTLRTPFSAATHVELLKHQRTADPPVPETIVPDLPAGLQRICLQALERDPALRYADARELLEDLRRHLRGETVLARPSMLAARFEAQIEEQLDRARHWESQGLITREESRRLYRQLTSLLRPDSPWIIDSRKLTTSQVGLYLGGWMTLLAITVGMWFSWDDLSPTLHIAIPSAVTALLLGLGIVLHINNMKRYALGFLLTSSVTIPAVVWVILRETGALGRIPDNARQAEIFADPPQGFANVQLLVISGAWAAVSLLLRFATRSGAFSFTFCIAAVFCWLFLYATQGGFARPITDESFAQLGMRFAMFGGTLCAIGLALSKQEETIARSVGRQNLRRHDSWPILTTGTVSMVVGLTCAAWYNPEIYRFPQIFAGTDASMTALRSQSFIANGFVFAALAAAFGKRWSPARDWLGSALRWIIPSHFLGSLLAMERSELGGIWLGWLLALGAFSIIMCFVSVLKQWKPFLINGLIYFAIAYVRAFDRVNDHFSHAPNLRLALFGGLIVFGLFVMIAAWKLPDWLAGTKTWLWLNSTRKKIGDRLAIDPFFGDSASPR